MHPGKGWDWNLINKTLWDVDKEEVKKVPLGSYNGVDRLIWHYDYHGVYTVKSGYYLHGNVMKIQAQGCPMHSIWVFGSCGISKFQD